MTKEILINVGLDEVRVALIDHGRVTEILHEAAGQSSRIGNIYLGRVLRVVPGIQACFVDIGDDRDGFLGAREASPNGDNAGRDGHKPDISDLVCEGDAILVQVTKDPIGDKGYRLRATLSLPGRFLIYRPRQPGVHLSRRIEDEAERSRLMAMAETLATGEDGGPDNGFIVRTVAAGVDEDSLREDAGRLADHWRAIADGEQDAQAPSLLYSEPDAVSRTLRELMSESVERVQIDNAAAFAQAKSYVEMTQPDLADRIGLFTPNQDQPSLFGLHEVDGVIDSIFETRVDLPGGGWISIEETEALVAIDVNSGSFSEGRSAEDTATRTNLEAVAEVAAQLRLRGLGGIIIIDLLRMKEESHGQAVLDAMREASAGDRSVVHVIGLTGLGLLELTRKRGGEPLLHQLGQACGPCDGGGWIKSIATIGRAALRRAQAEAAAEPSGVIFIDGAPQVIAWLEREGRLDAFERVTGREIDLEQDESYSRDRFEISVEPEE